MKGREQTAEIKEKKDGPAAITVAVNPETQITSPASQPTPPSSPCSIYLRRSNPCSTQDVAMKPSSNRTSLFSPCVPHRSHRPHSRRSPLHHRDRASA
ncbi:hypothetical protein M0R45_016082 [Rubus argutus]|uniref:Uncharacterized protein n=1 Tax=Rubus argutus TaxID=59490 RepID=A0AAW1XSV9_RUBAR